MKPTTSSSRHRIAKTQATVLKNGSITGLALTLLFLSIATAQSQVVLGPFGFDSALFGDTLLESDAGAISSARWLNTINVDPGNPRYLTGPDFETGIANIGLLGQTATYTIGYYSPIINGSGADLGIVVARFSTDDFLLAVSTDGGMTFTSDRMISGTTAQDSGVTRGYFFGATPGLFTASLFVHSIDLGSFGLATGAGVNAVRITSSQELDLIRAAGFTPVPEPSTLSLMVVTASVLFGLGLRRSRLVRHSESPPTRRR